MSFGNDRRQIRRYFCTVWQKQAAGEPLEPLERLIASVIAQHPLGETLWEAQRDGTLPDQARYLERLKRLAGKAKWPLPNR